MPGREEKWKIKFLSGHLTPTRQETGDWKFNPQGKSTNMKSSYISIKANKKITPLDRYTGQWVAFADEKIVAHEGSLKRLMKKVKKLKGARKKSSVLLVPQKTEGPHLII